MTSTEMNDLTSCWIPLIAVVISYQQSYLTLHACIAAFIIGCIITLESYQHSVMLLTFFFISSLCTKYQHTYKLQLMPWVQINNKNNDKNNALQPSNARDYTQVLSIGIIPTVLILCHPIYMNLLSHHTINYIYGIYISISLGDTLSSELGMLAGTQPRLITSGEQVRHGTDGAITLLGLNCAAAGGLIIGCIDVLYNGWNMILLENYVIYATMGSVFDSIIGALYQSKLVSTMQSQSQSHGNIDTGAKILWKQLNNLVNIVSSIITCLIAYYMERQYLRAGIHADIALYVMMWLLLFRRIPNPLSGFWTHKKSTNTAPPIEKQNNKKSAIKSKNK